MNESTNINIHSEALNCVLGEDSIAYVEFLSDDEIVIDGQFTDTEIVAMGEYLKACRGRYGGVA